MAEDIETLKLVAEKSKFLVDTQIEAYRNKQSNAGTIIGVISLYIPFFLNGLQDAYWQIKAVAAVPLVFLLIALFLLLRKILFATPLGRGMKQESFDKLVNDKFSTALLYEIAANRTACQFNDEINNKVERSYNRAILCVIIAVIFSSLLLFIDKFVHPDKSEVQKTELVKKHSMENNNNNEPVKIPVVPIKDISIRTDKTLPKPTVVTPKTEKK